MHDPMNCVTRLHRVLRAPEWEAAWAGDADLLRAAAGDLAAALGRCRLFGVDPPDELDGTLDPDLTRAAAQDWADRLAGAIARAGRLGDFWDHCTAPREADALALGLLDVCQASWAAFLAIEEGFQAAVEADESAHARLQPLLDALMHRIDALDAALEPQAPLLAGAAETELLANWRANLAEPYSLSLPWWLDGRLERLAERAGAVIPESRRVGLAAPTALAPAQVSLPAVQELALAAKGGGAAIAPGGEYRWTAPDGRVVAVLRLPLSCRSPDDRLVVTFQTPDGRKSREADGWRVRLGRREAAVEGHKFPLVRADLGDVMPPLEVEAPSQPLRRWEPSPPENAP